MICRDYHEWHAAITFGAEAIVLVLLMAAVLYWDRRR